jgi:hypothetical protein
MLTAILIIKRPFLRIIVVINFFFYFNFRSWRYFINFIGDYQNFLEFNQNFIIIKRVDLFGDLD